MTMMMMRRKRNVLLALLLLVHDAQGAVTCKATSTIEQTTVTCYFGTDISKTSHNFNVQYYPPYPNAKPEPVLLCNWKTETEIACKQSTDVTFDRVVNNQITLHRWPSLGNWGSKYVCQLVPSTGEPLDPCELTFSKLKAATSTPSTTTGSSLLVGESARESRVLSILAIVISCILLVVVIVLVVIYFFRRRMKEKIALRKPRGKADGMEEGESAELLGDKATELPMTQPAVTECDNNTEEKERSRFWRIRHPFRKTETPKKPEEAKQAILENPFPPPSTFQKAAPEEPSSSEIPNMKESKEEKKARKKEEKRKAKEQKKQNK